MSGIQIWGRPEFGQLQFLDIYCTVFIKPLLDLNIYSNLKSVSDSIANKGPIQRCFCQLKHIVGRPPDNEPRKKRTSTFEIIVAQRDLKQAFWCLLILIICIS